jgi:hypothetical protein
MIPGNRSRALTPLRYTAVGLLAAALLAAGAPGDAVPAPAGPDSRRPPDSLAARRGAQAEVRRYKRRIEAEWDREADPRMRVDLAPLLDRYLAVHAEWRPRVIAALDGFAEMEPGDDWIAGHRVGMRIKQGWIEEAVEVARACAATRWWCDALLGLSLHVAGRIPEAEGAFDAALAAMPREVRYAWGEELTHVLSGSLQREYAEAGCDAREMLERRLWWLGDPLHTVAGNDRRTEHFMRVVSWKLYRQVLESAPLPFAISSWAERLRIEAGWPFYWWSFTILPSWVRQQHYAAVQGEAFIPTESAWLNPLASDASEWALRSVNSGERHRSPHGPVTSMDHQTAFFQRGDSLLVVSAAQLPRTMLVAGIALSRDPEEPPFLATDSVVAAGLRRFELRVPPGPYLVSAEALAVGGGAHRDRFGHSLPGHNARGFGLSDAILVRWDGGPAEELHEALPRMLGTRRIQPHDELALFWEIYGVTEGVPLSLSLSVHPEERGILRRVGERLGLLGPLSALAIRWKEEDLRGPVVGREMGLSLAALPPGDYTLVLEADDGSGEAVRAVRRIEVVGG